MRNDRGSCINRLEGFDVRSNGRFLSKRVINIHMVNVNRIENCEWDGCEIKEKFMFVSILRNKWEKFIRSEVLREILVCLNVLVIPYELIVKAEKFSKKERVYFDLGNCVIIESEIGEEVF